ncbi:MAG: hypothetical protein ACON3Z_12460 [Bradymonadia bacterium]
MNETIPQRRITTTRVHCIAVAIALLMSLAGCGTPNRMTHLKDTLRTFNQQVRWGMWPAASAHVGPKMREMWLASRLSNAAGLKISDVKLVRVTSDGPRATQAEVLVSLTWYRVDDMTLQAATWKQDWEHSRAGWSLVGEERLVSNPNVVKPIQKDGKQPPGTTNWP